MAQTWRQDDSVGGYTCEFVNRPPENLVCIICHNALREAHILDCCGIRLCATCVAVLDVMDDPLCPHCRERFKHIRDPSCIRQVLSLKVYCSRREDGCQWESELRNLERHERDECGYVPVMCSNQCGEKVVRHSLEEHEREECIKRPVELQLSSYKRRFESLEKKFQEYRRETEKHLLEQRNYFTQELYKLEDTIQRYKHKEKNDLRQEFQQELVELRGSIFRRYVINGYIHKKNTNGIWYSPPFYSGPRGYKMCIRVDVNGNGACNGTHVSVFVHLMRGEHDDNLTWPFRGTVKFQLLNQKRNAQHKEWTTVFDNDVSGGSDKRVLLGDKGVGWGKQQFITHTELENSPYLCNDQLVWCVTEIFVASS